MGQEVTNKITGLVRRENWARLLSEILTERQNIPFKWGEIDCCLWPADVIERLTGVDFSGTFRGHYDDEAGAARMMKPYGGTITGIFTHFLGEPMPFPLKARRGDVVAADIAGHCCGGVVDDSGRRVAFITIERGLVRLPLKETMLVWGYG